MKEKNVQLAEALRAWAWQIEHGPLIADAEVSIGCEPLVDFSHPLSDYVRVSRPGNPVTISVRINFVDDSAIDELISKKQ